MATKKRLQLQDTGPTSGGAAGGERAAPVREVLPLDSLLGQDAAVRTLRAAMSGGRLHHAWILHGPQGVGKFTAALAFASMLLDPGLQPDLSGQLVPDPESATQRLIRAGTHPDLHVVTKELAKVSREPKIRDSKQVTIAREVIEEFLIDPASRTRVQIGDSLAGKVFIVDEAELLHHVPQNLLLKTLEEPAAGTVIILVTSNEDRLFSTIRSRSQRVRFSPLPEVLMRDWVKRAGVSLDGEALAWLLRFAAGSPGMAKLALDHGLLAWHEALAPMLDAAEQGRFPLNFGMTMHRLVDEQAAAWVKKSPDASKDAANKAWARRLLGYLGEHYRGRMAWSAGGNGGPGIGRCVSSIDAIVSAEEDLNTNVNMQFVFENLAVKLCAERRA